MHRTQGLFAFSLLKVARSFVLAAITLGQVHAAQPYPTKPVRLIVPFAPGGGTDILARTVGQKLSELWGQQVIVDNRGGGGTVIGTELAVRAVPDGYTLLLANIALALNPGLHPNLPFDASRDLTPVILIASQPNAIAANPGFAPNSTKELIAFLKSKGAKTSFGSSGSGGVGHISGEMFRLAIGADMVHIPYKGGGPAAVDLMAGQIPLAFISLPTVMTYMKAGRLKVLAMTDSKRSAAAPDIPTVGETVPGFAVDNWVGLLAPAGTPKPLVDKLNADIRAAIQTQEMRTRLTGQGFDAQGSSPGEFGSVIKNDIAKYTKVIRQANIREQ
jgi:tripartite-type tricarboxylate transporter receptor subunit TctC